MQISNKIENKENNIEIPIDIEIYKQNLFPTQLSVNNNPRIDYFSKFGDSIIKLNPFTKLETINLINFPTFSVCEKNYKNHKESNIIEHIPQKFLDEDEIEAKNSSNFFFKKSIIDEKLRDQKIVKLNLLNFL